MSLDSLNSAITGLESDSAWLDVIGNNIANVNTTAFKSSRTEFATQLSLALYPGTSDSPLTGKGGADSMEIGTGTRLESIQTDFTQGVIQSTGSSLDVAIDGIGFLTVKQGNQVFFTRAGVLSLDSQGYLVDSNGAYVQGYNALEQYTDTVINTPVDGGYAQITDGQLALDNSNLSVTQNIRLDPQMTIPPKATTLVNFTGNLDSFQQPNVLAIYNNSGPVLPVGLMLSPPQIPAPAGIDTSRMTTVNLPGGGFALKQVNDLSTPNYNPKPVAEPIINGIIPLTDVVMNDSGNYAWEQNPPISPAAQATETVYDSTGNPRQITVLFYQVNDLGNAGINPAPGPNQVCYAWYAFDTTGGQAINTAHLLGGTAIQEGDMENNPNPFAVQGYDHGLPFSGWAGDFIWFNTDGSLASSGGIEGPPSPPGTPNIMDVPTVFLPAYNPDWPPLSPLPSEGAEITAVQLNFGTYGIIGVGQRNGLHSDAEGSYKIVNGVNTYVPHNDVQAASQNGYGDGLLQSMDFQTDGTLIGTFSNGQTAPLAQLALSSPVNSGGLVQAGNNYFTVAANTGPITTGLAGTNGFGLVRGGSLENSNVNLTVEMTNMIVAQRGFDSNAWVISAVEGVLLELDGLGLEEGPEGFKTKK